MAKILIIGGGGMVGQKLAASLAETPLCGADDRVTLFDLGFPADGAFADHRITGNLTDPEPVKTLVDDRPDIIFHLASIVSGEAESDFDLGWAVNGHAFWAFLEAVRAEHIASGRNVAPAIDLHFVNRGFRRALSGSDR